MPSSIRTDLLRFDDGLYIARVEIDGRCSALGEGESAEVAEERAYQRALGRFAQCQEGAALAPSTPIPPAAQAAFDRARSLKGAQPSYGCSPPPPPAAAEPPPAAGELPPVEDVGQVLAEIDVEMARCGWKKAHGRDHLQQTYGVRQRAELTPDQLLEFLAFLRSQVPLSELPF